MIEAIRGKARLLGVSMGTVAILLSACAQAKSPGAVGSPPAPPPTATPSASPPAPSPSTPTPKPKPKPAAQVGIRSIAGIGKVLDSSKGLTLYHLTTDSSRMTTCSGGCAQTWPPLLAVNGKVPSLSGVMGSFGTIKRPEGTLQLTFDGMPLYTFAGDSSPGQANGQGIGGVWFAVKV